MKFAVLALDYDGTITTNNLPDPEVRSAIEDVRRHGVLTILVTGRIFGELQWLAGDLRFFDAVVAENGGVLVFPEGRRQITLGPKLPAEFLNELGRRHIDFQAGACLVETDAANGAPVLAVIRSMELPLVPLFNRGRLMILPQGISKATGLHAALRLFRVSEHNAIGIGDAENDHALLQACEFGVAVQWGSPALRAVADEVLPGDGPPAVAPYIRAAARRFKVPIEHADRHRLLLGHSPSGEPVTLAVHGRNVLIVGDSHSGKSWIAGLLCEQLTLQRYSLCVIDPEGDHRALERLPGVVALGGGAAPPPIHEIALALRHPDLSVVIDLSKVQWQEKCEYVSHLLPQVAALRRRTGLPHRIIVDEAHHFLCGPAARSLLDPELDGYTLITYRLTDLDPEVRAASTVVIAAHLTNADEVRLLYEMNGSQGDIREWSRTLRSLATREAVLLPITRESNGRLHRFRLEPRLTPHVRHREKYADVRVPDWLAFVFTDRDVPTGQRAHTIRELASSIRGVAAQVLTGHLQRGDFSRWVASVFADPLLAAQTRVLEQGYAYEALSDVRSALARLIEERYELVEGAA